MGVPPRRSRLQIWTDLLVAIRMESRQGPATPTRVQSIANLPHDRFRRHLLELQQRGLIDLQPMMITARGNDFLRQCAEMQEFLQRFGLAEDSPMVVASTEVGIAPSSLRSTAA